MSKLLFILFLLPLFVFGQNVIPTRQMASGWIRKGVVMTGWKAAEGMNNYEPSVIRERNPIILTADTIVFKMWYTSGWNSRDINYAESLDGVTWTKYASNPVITNHSRGFVLKNGSTYYDFCANAAQTQIDQYTSSDGVTWTLAHAAVINPGGGAIRYNSSVIVDGSTWRMLVDGLNGVSAEQYYYTSSDGITWSIQNGGLPVMTGLGQGAPMLLKIGGTFYAWVQEVSPQPSSLPTDFYRFSSPDMINWTQNSASGVPAFPRRQADEGPQTLVGQVADPFLLAVDSSVYLYYSASINGLDSAAGQRIKLAIVNMSLLKLVQTVESDGSNVILPETFAQAGVNDFFLNGSGSVAIGGRIPDSKALLDLTSTTKAFLPPRMTTANMNAISSPATGSVIYNTTLSALHYYNGSAWINLTGWLLIGNAVSDSLNGVGTTNTNPFQILQNNVRRGYIGSALQSVWYGAAPTTSTTLSTQINNTMIGWVIGGSTMSSANANVGVGAGALPSITTATQNTVLGTLAGGGITTAARNTYTGYQSGNGSNGNDNVGNGWRTLFSNTGGLNTAIGDQAMAGGAGAGNNNTTVGVNSLNLNTSGSNNEAFGAYAGFNNTTGNNQIFLGAFTGRNNLNEEQTLNVLYGIKASAVLSQSLAVNGKLGVNNYAPTAYLQLPPNTTVANTAPLNLTYTSLVTTAAAGSGTVATITFAAQASPPFIVGTLIVVAGMTPNYNGTATVVSCTTTQVTYASATTGAQTVAGTIVQGQLSTVVKDGNVERDSTKFYLSSGSGINLARNEIIKGTYGQATLSGGTVTVSTAAVKSTSIIHLTDATTGVLSNVGNPTVGTIVAGTSFVINSTNVLDASNVNWIIVNP